MARYVKKPIEIEAYKTDKEMIIHTLEGDMKANIGDYIITGIKGEQYPCKPDIFEATYEIKSEVELPPELPTEVRNEVNERARKAVQKLYEKAYQDAIEYPENYGDIFEGYENNLPTALALINWQKMEIESLTINMNAYGLAAKRLAEQKTEVAREIFEEIDNWFELYSEREYSFAEEETSKGHLPEAEAHDYALDIIKDLRHLCVAELKKKYAENCTTCKHLVTCEPNPFGICEEYSEAKND